MGCGGSKNEVLEGCEKPLCHKMAKLDIEDIDNLFEKCSGLICQVEEKRKFLVDEMMDNCYHTGAFAYKCGNLKQGLECAIWRLGVDNKGNVSEIGLNVESQTFEGSNNSQKGNDAANNMVGYVKCLGSNWKPEDLTGICDDLSGIANELAGNMDKYTGQISEKFSSSPLKVASACRDFKTNLNKSQNALSCLKELTEKLRELTACVPEIMAMCSPDKMNEQSACVELACKSKQTENLPIAFCVIPEDHRRAKTFKEVEDCYRNKLKARKECLAKIGSA